MIFPPDLLNTTDDSFLEESYVVRIAPEIDKKHEPVPFPYAVLFEKKHERAQHFTRTEISEDPFPDLIEIICKLSRITSRRLFINVNLFLGKVGKRRPVALCIETDFRRGFRRASLWACMWFGQDSFKSITGRVKIPTLNDLLMELLYWCKL